MRVRVIVCAAAVLGLVVVPFAVAGAASDSGDPRASASASVKKKVKKLNKKVKALEQEQGEPRPPSGAAGGDLSGSYPNPGIASGAVGAGEIAGGAVGTGEIARSVPAASVRRPLLSHQTMPEAETPIQFTQETYDSANMHSGSGTTVRAPVTGIYQLTAEAEWQLDPAGQRSLNIRDSDGSLLASETINAAATVPFDVQNLSTVERLSAGEELQLLAEQSSGGSLNINSFANSPEFKVTWLAPGP